MLLLSVHGWRKFGLKRLNVCVGMSGGHFFGPKLKNIQKSKTQVLFVTSPSCMQKSRRIEATVEKLKIFELLLFMLFFKMGNPI